MRQTIEQIQASLAQARDAQVSRIVAMVDAMPQRGDADALIAPLRPRLAQLRPARPPGFTRLLFTPLNPVIAAAGEWRPCGVGVPRSALAPLGVAVRAALPSYAGWHGDWNTMASDGAALWPAAAAVLDGLPVLPDWTELTGLQTADFSDVTRAAAAVLHEASAIERLASLRNHPDDDAVWPILSRSRARSALAVDTVVAVLLARLPLPVRVAALVAEMAGGDGATGRAIDRLAASVSAGTLECADLREAALEAGRVAAMLDALEAGATAERRVQLDAIRRDADALSRRCFSHAVSQTMALANASMTASCDDNTMTVLETWARDLRRLETAGRKLGGADHYDAMLASTVAVIGGPAGELGLADRVRLVEILAGPEQALGLLAGVASRVGSG